jgi:hypothetical protein
MNRTAGATRRHPFQTGYLLSLSILPEKAGYRKVSACGYNYVHNRSKFRPMRTTKGDYRVKIMLEYGHQARK